MNIPDKLTYTKSEKISEIACGALAAAFAATMIMLMVCEITGGENIIFLVVLLIIYGIFTLCSVYPQHTNIFTKPEKISEKGFRAARRAFLIGKAVLMAAIFLLSLPLF